MPLIPPKFKKAPKVDTEEGMPQDSKPQSLALAYNVRRQAAKKKKMAFGGKAEDDQEPVMPKDKDDDYSIPEDEYMMDHFDDGGEVHPESIADAIRAKKKKMAEGGQVELSENAEEEPNNEDILSYEALRKENYSESAGLDQLDQPEDSNLKGHMLSDEDEHDGVKDMSHEFEERMADDMVDTIRKRMRAKRGA